MVCCQVQEAKVADNPSERRGVSLPRLESLSRGRLGAGLDCKTVPRVRMAGLGSSHDSDAVLQGLQWPQHLLRKSHSNNADRTPQNTSVSNAS